ncbi:MAG: hypothetical protein WC817_00670 [Patescibacteria group bacterium]|jgi:hypothetical protein
MSQCFTVGRFNGKTDTTLVVSKEYEEPQKKIEYNGSQYIQLLISKGEISYAIN